MGKSDTVIMIKGAGEMASAIACSLYKAGFTRILMTELQRPLSISRQNCFSEAFFSLTKEIDGVKARSVKPLRPIIHSNWIDGFIAVLHDPTAETIVEVEPKIIIDARNIKNDPDTAMEDAEFVIGLGDAFTAGVNCHIAIPSATWKTAGKDNVKHSKTADTISIESVNIIKSNMDGFFTTDHKIGDSIQKDAVLANINEIAVKSPVKGMIRSILRNKTAITAGTKIAEIDTQIDAISLGIRSKWRRLSEAVLEAVVGFIGE
ncbi:MAG: hypothetical protein IKR78_05725 [Dehalococcoidales bacterium]|nr:hypothetical protein [Dehalococcoidales bacterium]